MREKPKAMFYTAIRVKNNDIPFKIWRGFVYERVVRCIITFLNVKKVHYFWIKVHIIYNHTHKKKSLEHQNEKFNNRKVSVSFSRKTSVQFELYWIHVTDATLCTYVNLLHSVLLCRIFQNINSNINFFFIVPLFPLR